MFQGHKQRYPCRILSLEISPYLWIWDIIVIFRTLKLSFVTSFHLLSKHITLRLEEVRNFGLLWKRRFMRISVKQSSCAPALSLNKRIFFMRQKKQQQTTICNLVLDLSRMKNFKGYFTRLYCKHVPVDTADIPE